jgi:hypothetical protein
LHTCENKFSIHGKEFCNTAGVVIAAGADSNQQRLKRVYARPSRWFNS